MTSKPLTEVEERVELASPLKQEQASTGQLPFKFSTQNQAPVPPNSAPLFSFSSGSGSSGSKPSRSPRKTSTSPSSFGSSSAPASDPFAKGSKPSNSSATVLDPSNPFATPVTLFAPAASSGSSLFSFKPSGPSKPMAFPIPGSLSSESTLSSASSPAKSPIPKTEEDKRKAHVPKSAPEGLPSPSQDTAKTIETSPNPSSVLHSSAGLQLYMQQPDSERVASFAQSNLSPSESETTYFQLALKTSEIRHAELNEEIARKQEELKRDIEERSRLKESLVEYRAIVNPVKRLPDNVLQCIFHEFCDTDIFQACSTWNTTSQFPRSLSVNAGPWVLARVCHRWKQIAEAFSAIWSTVCVDNDMPRKALYLLGLQIQRSAQHPLNVVCRIEPKAFSFGSGDVLFPLLLSTSFRWQGLVLRVPFSTLHETMLPVRGAVSNLSRVALQLCPEKPPVAFNSPVFGKKSAVVETAPLVAPVTFLEFAPKLTLLEVAGLYEGQECLVLPWDQLKDLTLLNSSTRSPCYLSILARASSLKELQLEELRHDQTSPREVSIPQPDLKQLHLYNNAYGVVDQVLDKISAPSLSRIYIQQVALWKLPSLTSFLRKSSCTLTHLFLRLPEAAKEAETLALLESLTSLEDLTIASSSDAQALQQLISGLTCDDPEVPRNVPNLASLTIHKPNSWTPTALVDMIASRCLVGEKESKQDSQPRMLEIVKVGDIFQSTDSKLLEKLQQCKDSGLVFTDSYFYHHTH